MKRVYQAADGEIFETAEKCIKYERKATEGSREKYLRTYSGKRLLEEHSLDETGIWEIRGEDPNPDMGGYHHNPYIATVQGTLEKAIDYAVISSNFWTWGGGGQITKKDIKEL
jgi:hypothetical protein